MIKKEQNLPKLISIPDSSGQYHTIIVPEREPWYIVLAANTISIGAVIAFVGYMVYVAMTV